MTFPLSLLAPVNVTKIFSPVRKHAAGALFLLASTDAFHPFRWILRRFRLILSTTAASCSRRSGTRLFRLVAVADPEGLRYATVKK